MEAKVREVYSTDVDVDTYRATSAADEGVWVRFIAGPEDGPGDESFDMLICSPAWLQIQLQGGGSRLGLHHLIMEPFDLRKGVSVVTAYLEDYSADDWCALSGKLSRIGAWEFEDYQHYDS